MAGLFLSPQNILAQTTDPNPHGEKAHIRGVQSGEVVLEQEDAKKDNYAIGQDEAIDFFKQMDKSVKLLSAGKSAQPATISDAAMYYLTGVYLYCSINSGVCPLVPESILEADIINARLTKNEDCPQMKRFWTNWVKNDMEQRFSYMVKTSFMSAVTDFNTKVRPSFIRCQDTVKEKTAGNTSNEEYFKARYTKDSRPAIVASKMVMLLSALKEKVPNVFVATGSVKVGQPDNKGAAGRAK